MIHNSSIPDTHKIILGPDMQKIILDMSRYITANCQQLLLHFSRDPSRSNGGSCLSWSVLNVVEV